MHDLHAVFVVLLASVKWAPQRDATRRDRKHDGGHYAPRWSGRTEMDKFSKRTTAPLTPKCLSLAGTGSKPAPLAGRGQALASSWPKAVEFQPLLYVDADVIVDRPIQKLLARLSLSAGITAQEEAESPLCSAPSVGAGLFSEDGMVVDGRNGFCAGILGIPNLRDHAETLRKILETIRRVHSAKQRPRAWRGDQPIANYVAVKTASFDPALLTPFVRYTRGNMRGGDQPLGLVHFWGSGKGAHRPAAMQRYLDEQLGARGRDD
jgi:hypothetical protein